MTKIILASAAMLIAVNATAQIRIIQSDFIEEKAPLELKATRDNVVVAFDVTLDEKVVKSGEVCVLTPQFVRDGVVLEALPCVVIEGRKYAMLAREKRDFDETAVIPYDAGEIYETMLYKGGDVDIHYQYKLPYRSELKGASLVLNQNVYSDCGIGTGRKDKSTGLRPGGNTPVSENNFVLAKGVTDYSDFRRNNQVAYYYPNRIDCRYENNFSNKSVFRIDSRTIDMDAFVRYGYTDFKNEIEKLRSEKDVVIQKIQINTSASPEGSLRHNKSLAQTRANVIANYLVKNLGLSSDLIEKQWVDENWDAFMHDLGSSDLDNKDQIRRIVNSVGDLDQREKELRKLNNWNEIFRIFQSLRNCHIVVFYSDREHFADEILIGGREMAVVEMSGKPAVSVEKTAEFYKADPQSITGLNNMMVALAAAGRTREAEEYALRIPNRNLSPVVANNKGVLYSLLGERRMATTMFEMATDVPMSDYNLGLMHLGNENYDTAADMLDGYNVPNSAAANLDAERNAAAARNTHIDDVTADNYYMRAVAYANDGEDRLAVNALEKAIALDPSYRQRALNQAEFIDLHADPSFSAVTGREVIRERVQETYNQHRPYNKSAVKAAERAEKRVAAERAAAEKNAARAAKKAAEDAARLDAKASSEKANAERVAAKVAAEAERLAADAAKAEAKIAAEKAAAERSATKAAERIAADAAKAEANAAVTADKAVVREASRQAAEERAAAKAAAKAAATAEKEAARAAAAVEKDAERMTAEAAKLEAKAAEEQFAAERDAARIAEKAAEEAAKAEAKIAAEKAAAERAAMKAAADAEKNAAKAAAATKKEADKIAAETAKAEAKAAAQAAKAEAKIAAEKAAAERAAMKAAEKAAAKAAADAEKEAAKIAEAAKKAAERDAQN